MKHSLPDITAAEFRAALKHHGFRMVGTTQIVSYQCPGVVWTPVTKSGRIDRAGTLHKVVQARREEMARQGLTSMA
jgi:hypothetical protein